MSRRPIADKVKPLFDISGVDLSRLILSRRQLERYNAHRDQMAMLDGIVWQSEDYTLGVAIKHVRDDEFWVKGHFPGRPMFPGVLMIECGAQLACYLYNVRMTEPLLAAFLRIDSASFRASVCPGEDLLLLCKEVKFSRRRFVSDIQGLVGDRVTFQARITGMGMGELNFR